MTDISLLPNIASPIRTSRGTFRHKYRLRAAFRSVAFLLLVVGFCIHDRLNLSFISTHKSSELLRKEDHRRILLEDIEKPIRRNLNGEWTASETSHYLQSQRLLEDNKADKADPAWLVAPMAVGVLYLFLALAIVCDEFFVPALEEISGEHRLNLSMDVAGATLMAAGGSAPELFTSLFGTFNKSVVGFGTIVGSAVFNVLFVIGMCAMFSKEVLTLTWWPLFRDSFYYAIGLCVLAVFVGFNSKGIVEMWEAIVLFVMYIIYVIIMYYNRKIYTFITGKELVLPGEEVDEEEEFERSERLPPKHWRWPVTFRAGVLKLLRDPESWVVTAGVGIVSKMVGDVDIVFKEIDENGDGFIDREEFNTLFENLDCNASREEIEAAFKLIDEDKDGVISANEFKIWYTQSEDRIKERVKVTFDFFDTNKNGSIDRSELKSLLERIEPRVTEKDIDEAMEACDMDGDKDEISFDDFSKWYLKSLIFQKQQKEVEEDMKGIFESLAPPSEGSLMDYLKWLVVFPIICPLTLTIPDVRREGCGKYCYVSFLFSIGWIGGFSYFMVDWAETIGATVGIPSMIMGLTFLAAGTSVPDLLTSVIVARMGEGDMAVSSSIGSNIFDILVGLPLPWIIFTAWPNDEDTVKIEANNVWISILVLLGMLLFIITAIHLQGWKLTKVLGYMMFVGYFCFLVQAILVDKYVKL